MTSLRRALVGLRGLLVDESTIAILEHLIMALIVLNTAVVALGTVHSLTARYGSAFTTIEYVVIGVFTVEFVVRVAGRFHRREDWRDWLSALVDPYLLIDLLAILPVYVGLLRGARGLRTSGLFRVLRLFKLVRYFHGFEVLSRVVRRKRADLVASILLTGLLWILAASAIYYAEAGAQPRVFSSIPAAMWWAGTTITTVGYGDVYPITPLGRLLGVVVSLLGVGIAAVPSGILVTGFLEETGPPTETCPHCGRPLDE